jgi:hypothetical protein
MIANVSVDVGYVDVDVDLGDIETEDLIGELESRGFEILEKNDPLLFAPKLTREQQLYLINIITAQNPAVGSELHFIREKLVRT